MTTPRDPAGGEPAPRPAGFAAESPRVTYAAARPPAAVHRAFLALVGYLAVGLFWSVERLVATAVAVSGSPAVAGPTVGGAVVGVLLAVVVSAVALVVAVHMRAGWTWARVTVTALAALALVLALVGIAGQISSFRVTVEIYGMLHPVSSVLLGAAQAVLLVVALLLVHRREAARYFH